MKYEMRVYYRTPQMDEVTESVQKLIPEWKARDRRLEGCRTFQFEVAEPLSDEKIEKMKALKEDWMTEIVIEEVR